MKKGLNIIIGALSVLLFVSCATQNQNDSGFYGYDNSPEREIQSEPEKPKKEWENPLADKSSYEEPEREQMVINNYYYGNQGFVPVIAPWYGGYYGWGSRARGGGVFLTYGTFRSYEWYSPWYDFHPYYGCTWYDYYYVNPHYRTWYNQPIYAYSPYYGRSWQYFGNSRPNTRNDVSYNPRSSNVDYRRTSANYGSNRSGERRSNSRSNGQARQGSSRSTNSYSPPANSNGSYRGSSGRSSGSSSGRRGSSGSYEKSGSSSRSSGSSRGSNSRGGSSRGGSSSRRGGGR